MSKYTEIFNYMRTCPQLADLWSIGAAEDVGVSVILPQGASPAVQYQEQMDVYGNYECEIVPYPSVYEDYQVNCYKILDSNDGSAPEANINVLSISEVQEVCDWVAEQNALGHLPSITGKKVVSVECNPFVPQIRYVDTQRNIIAYFITVRIRYVNPMRQRSVTYDAED